MNDINKQINEVLRIAGVEQLDEELKNEMLSEKKLVLKSSNDYFTINGKDFDSEDYNLYKIYNDNIFIGNIALRDTPQFLEITGLKILPKYRLQGYGEKVVNGIRNNSSKPIYVRAIPEAKEFWDKFGHNSIWNKDSGTYDGMLSNATSIHEDLVFDNVNKLNEELNIDNWNELKNNVINDCFQYGELDSIIQDNELTYYIDNEIPSELKEELIAEADTDDIFELVEYALDNYKYGVSNKIHRYILSEKFEMAKSTLLEEFANNNIYRAISSNKDINEVLKEIEKVGTGNCWAKQFENAEAYYGGNDYKYLYIIVGEATLDNIDLEQTLYLRMVADYENEVRLKKESEILVKKLLGYEYNGSEIVNKKEISINNFISTGSKYIY